MKWKHPHSIALGTAIGAGIATHRVWMLVATLALGFILGYMARRIRDAFEYVVRYWEHRNTDPKRRPKTKLVPVYDPRKARIPYE